MSDTRHLREGMVDVDGDGVPDWVLHGDAEMPLDDQFALTSAEAAARDEDAEVAHRAPDEIGEYADLPPQKRTLTEQIIASATEVRQPVLGPTLSSRQGRKALWIAIKRLVPYYGKYWAARGPIWVLVRLWWVVRGVFVAIGRYVYWVRDGEGRANIKEVEADKKSKERADHRIEIKDRIVASVVAAVAALALALTCLLLPEDPCQPWGRLVLYIVAPGAALVGLIVLGKPPERRWVGERIVKRGGWSRLTQESVRSALADAGLVKDVTEVRFARTPKILAQGDLVYIQLPRNVLASKIIKEREALAGGLGVLLDQCYPFAVRRDELPGWPVDVCTLGLLVTHKPTSEMTIDEFPRWPLIDQKKPTDVFKAGPIAHDVLFRIISTPLMELNTCVGGRPGSGKSGWLQAILGFAMYDPICQLIVCEYKGVGDFMDGEAMYSDYVCGIGEQHFDRGLEILRALLKEADLRGQRINDAKRAGLADRGKITRKLAEDRSRQLWPILAIFDEFHELLIARPEAAPIAERLIKRGRALGIHLLLATQIPDSKSVPPNMFRSIAMRICAAVGDHYANDLILGNKAYRQGWDATQLRPSTEEEPGDGGWAWFKGVRNPVFARSFYPHRHQWLRMCRYAHEVLRGGKVVGAPAEPDEEPPTDIIIDVLEVFHELGTQRMQWGHLLQILARNHPGAYDHLTPDGLSDALREAGGMRLDENGKRVEIIQSRSVRGKPGSPQGPANSAKGCVFEEVMQAHAARQLPAPRNPAAIEGATADASDPASNDASNQATEGATDYQARNRADGKLVVVPLRPVAWTPSATDDAVADDDGDDDDVAEPDDDPDDPDDEVAEDDDEDEGPEPAEPSLVQMAAEIVITNEWATTAMLQRKLRIGHAECVRVMEILERHRIVGPAPAKASMTREVLVKRPGLPAALRRLDGAEEVP